MFTIRYDTESTRLIGATRTADGVQIARDGAGWGEVVAWAAAQEPPVELTDNPPLTDAQRLALARTAAVSAFLTSNEPMIVATRALFRLAFTWINDERESRGAPRILEPDIIALAMGGTINDGLGDAPAGAAPVPPEEPSGPAPR